MIVQISTGIFIYLLSTGIFIYLLQGWEGCAAVCAGCSVKTCKEQKSTPICSPGRDVTTVAVILLLQGFLH